MVIEAIQGVIPPPEYAIQNRHLQIDRISSNIRRVTVFVGVFEANDGFFHYFLPSAVLKVEDDSKGFICMMAESIVNCDLGPSDIDIWAGQMKIVQGIHLALGLGASVCSFVGALHLYSYGHEEPEIQIGMSCRTREALGR